MPVVSNATSAVSGSLPKWQLALVVGAPVALGLGYIYYKNTNQNKKSRDCKGDKSNGTANEKQISIDGDVTTSLDKPQTQIELAQRYKKQGNQSFGIRKYEEAIFFYNSAIEEFPPEETEELAKIYQNRAAAYEALEDDEAVKRDCTKALELNPKYIKALLRRARVMEKTNELEVALEDVTAACMLQRFMDQTTLSMADRVLKQLGKQHAQEYMATRTLTMPSKHFMKTYFNSFKNDPLVNKSFDEVSEGVARALKAFQEQKYEDIIDICTEELDKCNKDDISNWMRLTLMRGTFYLLLGKHDKAINDLETIINNEEADKDIRVNALIKRATRFIQVENIEACMEDFNKAVSINPDCGDIYHHRGQVNLLLNNLEEALADSRLAVKLDPNDSITYAQECYAEYRHAAVNQGKDAVELAMAKFDRALELFPDCSECYMLYAQTLYDLQLFEKADSYFAKAIEKEPKNATIQVHRGLLQLHWTGNVDKAIEYINKALKCDDKCEFGYETLGTIEVQKGNLQKAVELYDKALVLAKTTIEVTNLFSFQDAAKAQLKVGKRLPQDSLIGLGNIS